MGLDQNTFVITNAAFTKTVGGKSVVYFPSATRAGKESVGLKLKPSQGLVAVPAVAVDDYVTKHAIKKVDVMLVDTEGNDANVLYGAAKTLEVHKPSYVIFEYHRVLPWRTMRLKNVIDYMDRMNYDCYWAHDKAMLFQITKCWNNFYSTHIWSNIACHNRDDKLLTEIMQRFAKESVGRTESSVSSTLSRIAVTARTS